MRFAVSRKSAICSCVQPFAVSAGPSARNHSLRVRSEHAAFYRSDRERAQVQHMPIPFGHHSGLSSPSKDHFNDIGVRSFILPGAPSTYKTANRQVTLRHRALPPPSWIMHLAMETAPSFALRALDVAKRPISHVQWLQPDRRDFRLLDEITIPRQHDNPTTTLGLISTSGRALGHIIQGVALPWPVAANYEAENMMRKKRGKDAQGEPLAGLPLLEYQEFLCRKADLCPNGDEFFDLFLFGGFTTCRLNGQW